jgi:hypothetical protein
VHGKRDMTWSATSWWLGAVCKTVGRRVRFPCGPRWSGGRAAYGGVLLRHSPETVRGFKSRSLLVRAGQPGRLGQFLELPVISDPGSGRYGAPHTTEG